MDMAVPVFLGWIDGIAEKSIWGWAANAASPDSPVQVAIHVNGACVGVTACTVDRPDAVAAGHAGARAFRFDLTAFLKAGRNSVRAGFEQTAQFLPGGPQDVWVGDNQKVGDYWSGQYAAGAGALVTRWWESDYIVRRINRRICGEPVPGMSNGLHQLALKRFGERVPFAHGVSVGSGTGSKERSVIQCGLVSRFTLFELSGVAIERGQREARDAGLAGRMEYRLEDPMQAGGREDSYDLVYWNNSLHHMPDVAAAIQWSRAVLRQGGVLLMDDFVGPTRMQWSDRMLAINTAVRRAIPQRYLRDPHHPSRQLPTEMARPSAQALIAMDPSECADSSRILPALLQTFPDAWIKLTGGGVYHLGLNDILHNILEEQDFPLLDRLLDYDDQCAELGETHYAVAIAVK